MQLVVGAGIDRPQSVRAVISVRATLCRPTPQTPIQRINQFLPITQPTLHYYTDKGAKNDFRKKYTFNRRGQT